MRFVGTKRFSPVANRMDLPWAEDYFHVDPSALDKQTIEASVVDENWWHVQRDRCLNGYWVDNAIEPGGDYIIDGVDAIWDGDDCYLVDYDLLIKGRRLWIPGRLYFYLNFWIIYGLDENSDIKSIVNPRFLDIDYLFTLRVLMMQKLKLDGQELKGRQLGFSEKGAGVVIGYNFTFVDGSLNVIVAGVEEDALKTMRDCDRGLKYLVNTQFYKERARGGDSSTYIKAKNTESQIYCITAKDNPQAVSRFSPYWVWMEEIGKGKRNWSLDTAGYIRPSIETEGGKKTGYIHYIGTGGKMEDGVYDLEARHYDPVKHKILAFVNKFEEHPNKNLVGNFIAKDLFYKIDKDGNSLRAISRKKILEDRKLLSANERYLHTTQYPIYASEVFYTTSGGFFGDDITQLMNERVAFINNHKEEYKEKRGFLRWKNTRDKTKGVDFTPSEEGEFYIFEHPETNDKGEVPYNLYFGGTDSYDQDESFHSDSLGASRIWKGFLNADKSSYKWVAKILQRPTTEEGGAERFYENTALLHAYYNARNLIEFSKWRIIDWYNRNGLTWLLKERPDSILASFINNSKANNRWGIDPSTKKDWLNILRDKLTPQMILKMDDVDQLRRLAKFRYDPTGRKYNCDETIATALSVVHHQDEQDYAAIYVSDTKDEELPYFFEDSHGNIIHSFHK